MSLSIQLTKTKLIDHFRMYRNILGICDKFYVMNDVIVPGELTNEIISGGHWIRYHIDVNDVYHNIVYESVDNLAEILNIIRDTKGSLSNSIVYDNSGVYANVGNEVYTLMTPTNAVAYNPNAVFDSIVDRFMVNDIYTYSKDELYTTRLGRVLTIKNDTYGSVRLSKSTFPFMTSSKLTGDVNFSGTYSFGTFATGLNYIASHVGYKCCEALHVYVFTPF